MSFILLRKYRHKHKKKDKDNIRILWFRFVSHELFSNTYFLERKSLPKPTLFYFIENHWKNKVFLDDGIQLIVWENLLFRYYNENGSLHFYRKGGDGTNSVLGSSFWRWWKSIVVKEFSRFFFCFLSFFLWKLDFS